MTESNNEALLLNTLRLLFVEDDPDASLELAHYLKKRVSSLAVAANGREALDLCGSHTFDVILSDLRMPEMGGLEVQRMLLENGSYLPIILVSGYPEVHSAVEAIKKGAFDFLEKPVNGGLLVEKVQSALARSRQMYAEHLARKTREARLSLLTPKERQIAEMVVDGKSSPRIAEALDISVRTVENHRARLMEKLHVDSTIELVKLFL